MGLSKMRGLLLGILFLSVSYGEKRALCILPFQSASGSPAEAMEIQNLLTASIISSGRFSVLNQAGFDSALLLLKMKSDSPPQCSDLACLERIGKRLNVDFVVSGKIDTAKGRKTVSIQLVSIPGEEIVFSGAFGLEDNSWRTVTQVKETLLGIYSEKGKKEAAPPVAPMVNNAAKWFFIGPGIASVGVSGVLAFFFANELQAMNASYSIYQSATGDFNSYWNDVIKHNTQANVDLALGLVCLGVGAASFLVGLLLPGQVPQRVGMTSSLISGAPGLALQYRF